MKRGEAGALAVAAVGHVILFGLLSAGFLSKSEPMTLPSHAIDVSLVDDVAMQAAAPSSVEAPAKSIAPDTGAPTDAPPPADAPESQPAPESKAPEPAPAKKPSDTLAPEKPKKPAAEKPEKSRTPERKETSRKSEAPAKTPTKSEGKAKAKPDKPRGSRLGDDFLNGITDSGEGKATTPRAEKMSATVVAGLADAIQRQVQPCANRITNPGPGANEIVSKIRIQMNRDGSLAAKPQLRGQSGVNGENRRYSQRVAELAMSAFIACAPYKLPAEYYDVGGQGWKDIILNYKLPG